MALPSSAELPLDIAAATLRAMEMLQDWFVVRAKEEFNQDDWKYLTSPKLRDIVDSGRLRDSLQIIKEPDGSFTAVWTEPYASSVHEGGVDPETGKEFLGRPWTRDILRELPSMYAHFMGIALKEQAVAFSKSNSTGIIANAKP